MIRRKRYAPLVLLVACGAVLAVPATAQTIVAGIDGWNTPNDGTTSVDVNLPPDFFCTGSPPVPQIVLKGEPLETDPPTALGNTDTVIERLADGADGGIVPLQVRALCLRAADAIRVECADGSFQTWDVTVSLDGPQPVTEITITQMDPSGGVFDGQVAVRALITFTLVGIDAAGQGGNTGEEPHIDEVAQGSTEVPQVPPEEAQVGDTRTVTDEIYFDSIATPWVFDVGGVEAVRYEGEILVAEGCGATPSLLLPGTSNFFPGWSTDSPPPEQLQKGLVSNSCACICKCVGPLCRLPAQELALLARHGIIPPCRSCTCL